MKLHIDLPWGGVLDFERQPMSKERAEQITGLLFALIAAISVIKFFSLMVG